MDYNIHNYHITTTSVEMDHEQQLADFLESPEGVAFTKETSHYVDHVNPLSPTAAIRDITMRIWNLARMSTPVVLEIHILHSMLIDVYATQACKDEIDAISNEETKLAIYRSIQEIAVSVSPAEEGTWDRFFYERYKETLRGLGEMYVLVEDEN